MYLKFLQKSCCFGWFKNKPSALIRREENKVEFFERQFHSEKLSFVHKNESEQSFELSLPICVFYRHIFNHEMQNFTLENHHMMNASQPFCWRITSTKVWKPASSPPPKELEIFSLAYNGVFLHFNYIRDERYLSQWRILFFPCISLQVFSPRNQSVEYLSLKSPIISKVKLSAAKIHLTFAQKIKWFVNHF